MQKILLILLAVSFSIALSACRGNRIAEQRTETVKGFGILSRLPGTWHGPVISTTSAGSFPEWAVDFRPVSAGQISQFSLLDSNTVNNISFFIVRHKDELKVAMRTQGCFKNSCCATYEVIDSVNEEKGYYRFADFQGGSQRASTAFTFRGDSMIMEVYTSKFNKEKTPVLHSRWLAVSGDKTSANEAIAHFGYPKKTMIRNFNEAFSGMSESIFFDFTNEPYPEKERPYTGSAKVSISVSPEFSDPAGKELFVLLTTQSIFDGLKLRNDYKNYYSRYVFLPVGTQSVTFRNMHPGTYYLYAFADMNGDKLHLKGDLMSSATDNILVVTENSSASASVIIDMVIP
ncbi:MAG: hypothetical protein RB294_05840 [Bacteroidales bacterium]|jgi:hypothetical protein|nr:hypothetical protein [Bacteroidales bacterium]